MKSSISSHSSVFIMTTNVYFKRSWLNFIQDTNTSKIDKIDKSQANLSTAVILLSPALTEVCEQRKISYPSQRTIFGQQAPKSEMERS